VLLVEDDDLLRVQVAANWKTWAIALSVRALGAEALQFAAQDGERSICCSPMW
jgi:hypothetical protein